MVGIHGRRQQGVLFGAPGRPQTKEGGNPPSQEKSRVVSSCEIFFLSD